MSSGTIIITSPTKVLASPRKALSNITNISVDQAILEDVFIDIVEDLSITGRHQETLNVTNSSGLETTLSDASSSRQSTEPGTPDTESEGNTGSTSTTSKPSLSQIREDVEIIEESTEIIIDNSYKTSWVIGALKRYRGALKFTIQDHYRNNPCYVNPNAWELFMADHAFLFPASDQLLMTQWPVIAKSIITVAEMYKKRSKLIENILIENSETTTNAHTQNLALALVPAILVALAKSLKSIGRTWKPTAQEMSDSFLLQVPTLAELESKRTTYEDMLRSHNEPVQPYAILVGTLRRADYSYAVVNNHVYSMSSPLHAIDLCFKVYKIMRVGFSKLSFDAYKFLALHVYKNNEGSYNTNVGSLSELLGGRDLKRNLDLREFSLLKHIIDGSRQPFEAFSTEKKRFAIFREESILNDPEQFKIGERAIQKFLPGATRASLTFEPVFAVHIPLMRSLQIFFQVPGVYEAAKAYIAELDQGKTITNYRQGLTWQKFYSQFAAQHEDYFDLEVFIDDLQTGNGMGSAAGVQKLCGVFARCPSLPPHLVNKMYSIFATTIFYSRHREEFGNQCVFCKLIEELGILHDEGLRIVINGEEKTLFFALTQLIGDNLALNCTCGFSKSFTATHYCRCCTATANECKALTREVPALVRTHEAYDSAFQNRIINELHPHQGVIEKCEFNKAPIFKIGNNHYGDVMHDIGEGVCDYTLGGVLYNLINKDECFTIDDFNKRLEDFDFGPHETNIPRKIKFQKCKDKKKRGKQGKIRLKQSAAEMLCLTRNLGLIIGDLVPEDNENWKLYLKLRQIVDIVTAPSFTQYDSTRLEYLVSKHNELYIRKVGPLKPKMHFMTHYPRLMLENGPLINSWGMPFERKNKELKTEVDCETRAYFAGVEVKECVQRISHVQIFGKKFSEKTIFLADITDDGEPYFGEIQGVFDVSGKVCIIASMLQTLYFHEHRHAYKMSGKVLETRAIYIDDVPRIGPMLRVDYSNGFYLSCRYGF
ncbi:hypothetical protein QAD02_020748 [Eretmocerus hayati]|uniref:Uncharacterized protein n=1 Tax=Eretmocerus hayati TaxID=131215 RepID=A0ACC2PMX7_9HYME|nr:hypothetical protein QAD02_020748 [Eretmocerus hayati]